MKARKDPVEKVEWAAYISCSYLIIVGILIFVVVGSSQMIIFLGAIGVIIFGVVLFFAGYFASKRNTIDIKISWFTIVVGGIGSLLTL